MLEQFLTLSITLTFASIKFEFRLNLPTQYVDIINKIKNAQQILSFKISPITPYCRIIGVVVKNRLFTIKLFIAPVLYIVFVTQRDHFQSHSNFLHFHLADVSFGRDTCGNYVVLPVYLWSCKRHVYKWKAIILQCTYIKMIWPFLR